LQQLAECMFQLGLRRTEIDYNEFTFIADLTDEQIQVAISCQAEVVKQLNLPG
jgi:hypothetical protein